MSDTQNNQDTASLLKDAVFWVSIAGITVSLLKYMISYMLKSKCSDFTLCWGAIKIKRDIAIERDIEIAQINNLSKDQISADEKETDETGLAPTIRRPSIK
jgi:hypothetical protein